MATRIAVGDARKKLRLLSDEAINCFVTSPPYWLKRHYGAGPEEIGREPTIQEYVDNLMEVIDVIWQKLMPHGTFWLNLGDTYITQSGTARGTYYPEPGRIKNVANGDVLIKSGKLPHKCLCLLPYRVAIAMIDRGWIIRNIIIWWKPDCMPESAEDRFTVDYEPVFLCTKSPNYYFKQQLQAYSDKTLKRCKRFIEKGEAFDPARHRVDLDRPTQAPMKVLGRMASRIVKNLVVPGRTVHSMHADRAKGSGRDVFHPAGANMRCVQRIATAGYRGLHFAAMPEKLVELCINAGCPPGGRVCDPFLGSGTTGVIAERMGCDFYGIELNPEYAQQAKDRILAARVGRKDGSRNVGLGSQPTVDGGLILGKEMDDLASPLTVSEEPLRSRLLPNINIDCSEDEYVETDG